MPPTCNLTFVYRMVIVGVVVFSAAVLGLVPNVSEAMPSPQPAVENVKIDRQTETVRPGVKVTIEQGDLAGIAQGGVMAFLGVPYAAPPVGANRWRPPGQAPRWSGVRDASRFGAGCMQQVWGAFPPYTKEFLTPEPVSEDCLFLNVWTPAAAAGQKMPVLVFIHGGGFVGGSSSAPLYDGAALARNGIVVVTINYRLGVFGYLAHPELTAEDDRHTSGNYGLEDQIAALRWVQRNIISFGGDPDRVTVAGESGGAVSVNALMCSPDAARLFSKAAAYSGISMGFLAPSLAEAEAYGISVAKSVGATSLSQLRAVSARKLMQATSDLPAGPGGVPRFAFWPVVDGAVLPVDPNDGASRPVSAVPVLAGYNSDENSIMQVRGRDDLDWYARIWFGDWADRILALYPRATDEEARRSARVLARDRYMTSLLRWSDSRAAIYRQTIYNYLYSHASPVTDGPNYGAFHTAGMPYVFGNLDPGARPYVDDDKAMSNIMQAVLVNFVKSGKPQVPGIVGWDERRPTDLKVMDLDLRSAVIDGVSTPARFDVLNRFAASGGVLVLF